jgi:CubicO group peptidase (beta-lactamase class C family)
MMQHALAGRTAVGEAGTRPDIDHTWYDLASLTKPLVVGTLSLLAARTGSIELHAPLGSVLPPVARSAIGNATIAQLLSHSSGLPAWEPVYALAHDPGGAVEAIAEIELARRPGQRVEYSCLGFILLGKALEQAYGRPLDAVFEDHVSRPLGLHQDLGFRPDPSAHAVAAGSATPQPEIELANERGFRAETIPPVGEGDVHDGNARFLGGVAGNSGLFGTAAGVFSLAAEFTAGGEGLLQPEEIAAARTVVAADEAQVRGLAWQLAPTPGCSAGPALASAAFGHVGFTGTSLWIDPDRDAVYVLLTNRCHPDYRDVNLHPLRRQFHRLAAAGL